MRVTLSLRNNYERVERGRGIAVPMPNEPDTDDLLDRFLVIGSPDTVIRQTRRLEERVGITTSIAASGSAIAREVMPAFA